MKITDQNLIDVLKAAVYDVNLKELSNVEASTKISELGLDSVALMELIGILEENLSIRIADEEVWRFGLPFHCSNAAMMPRSCLGE